MDSIPLEVVYKNMYSEYPEILEVKDLCEILGYGKKKVYQGWTTQKNSLW